MRSLPLLTSTTLACISLSFAHAAPAPRMVSPPFSSDTLGSQSAIVDRTFSAALNAAELIGVTANGCVLVKAETTEATGRHPQFLWLRYDGLSGATVPLPADASVLAVLPDSHLIVSKPPYFSSASGCAATFTLPPAFDTSAALTAAVVQPDGGFVIAQGARLARLRSDGSLDPLFRYHSPRTNDASIRQLAVDRDGNIYTTIGRERPGVFRLNKDGSADSRFVCLDPGPNVSGSREITAHPLNDGRILLLEANSEGCQLSMLSERGTPDLAWSCSETFKSLGLPLIDPTGFIVVMRGDQTVRRCSITSTGLREEACLSPDDGTISGYVATLEGDLVVSGTFTSWAGHTTFGVALLHPTARSVAEGNLAAPQALASLSSAPAFRTKL